MTTTILIIGFALLMLPGLAFVLMFLPGIPYVFVVALLYGFVDGFHHLSLRELGMLAIIVLLSLIIDQLAGLIGARWGGAKGKSFLYGIAGLIIGNFVTPIIGGFIGLFLGIFVGEMQRRYKLGNGKQGKQGMHSKEITEHLEGSFRAAGASVIGSVSGMIANEFLAVVFITLFLIFTLR